MLSTLEIRNFRKFERYAVDLGPRNLLVGPNNAGKSTLIEAMRLVSIVANRLASLNFENPPGWLADRESARGVGPSLKGLDFHLGKETFHQYADPPAVVTGRFDNGNSLTVYVGPDADVFAVVRDQDGIAIGNKREARLFDQPRIGIQPQVGPLAARERPLADTYVRKSLDSTLAPLHFRNQLRLLAQYFAAFKEASEATWPNLRVDGVEIIGVGDECHLELFVRDGAFVGEVGVMGHGLQMWLQLMWFLARSEQDGTIVLDEPDVYMHPDLQRRLIRFVLSRDQQVIIATHSIEMIAEVEPSELVSIDATKTRSRKAQDMAEVQKVVDQVGGAHNIEFARLFRATRYLAIAPGDLRLVKRWHDVVAPEDSDALDLMATFPLNAWEDWPYAVAIKRAIEASNDGEITALCLLAPELHSAAAIETRRSEASAEGMDLHIWTRRAMLNFLLNPTVIARVLREETAEIGPTDSEVAAELDQIMKALRDTVISEAPAFASREVADQFESIGGRLALAPARLVLLRLAAWSRRELGQSAGLADIARSFTRNDVDQELTLVIEAIQRNKPLSSVRDGLSRTAPWPGSEDSAEPAQQETVSVEADDILDLLREGGVIA